jgi:Fe-S-cluster-containing hydrogenase component 2
LKGKCNLQLANLLLLCGVAGGVYFLFSLLIKGNSRRRIHTLLPGLDCGACGAESCAEYRQWLQEKKEGLLPCFPLLNTEQIKKLELETGVSFQEIPPRVARIHCQATAEEAPFLGEITGFEECHEVAHGFSQIRTCAEGCFMLGSCARRCPVGAIDTAGKKLRVADEKCVGCGLCVEECPQDLIELRARDCYFLVACANHETGSKVHQICQRGCLGCDVCAKVCPVDAIIRHENLVSIDTTKCINCGLCALKCPSDAIATLRQEPHFVTINPSECNGCELCVPRCPVGAISGENARVHAVDESKCIGCGICLTVCPRNAIDQKVME